MLDDASPGSRRPRSATSLPSRSNPVTRSSFGPHDLDVEAAGWTGSPPRTPTRPGSPRWSGSRWCAAPCRRRGRTRRSASARRPGARPGRCPGASYITCDHLVGQAHELAVDVGDIGRPGLEDRIAEDPDLVRRGGARHSAARLSATRRPYPRYRERRGSTSPSSRRRASAQPHGRPRPPRPHAGARHRPGRVRRRPHRPRHATCCCRRRRHRRPPGDLLDLGCGYGPIALTMARRAPRRHGVGRRRQRAGAGCCAPRTPRQHGLTNVRCVTPDAVPDDVAFATIWSNPPIRIGKAPLHELLLRWLGAPVARRRAPTSSCRSTSAPTRWRRG